MIKVLATDAISEKGLAGLAKNKKFKLDYKAKLKHDELLDIIADYDALLVRSSSDVKGDVFEKAKKLIDFEPTMDFRKGLESVYEWLQTNRENIIASVGPTADLW